MSIPTLYVPPHRSVYSSSFIGENIAATADENSDLLLTPHLNESAFFITSSSVAHCDTAELISGYFTSAAAIPAGVMSIPSVPREEAFSDSEEYTPLKIELSVPSAKNES